MKAGDIKIVLSVDDQGVTTKMERAGKTVQSFTQRVNEADRAMKKTEAGMNGFGARFRDVIFAVSLARFAFQDFQDIVLALPVAFIKAGGEMERMQALMEGLSKETDELKRKAEAVSNTQFVFNLAQNAPFELKTLTDVFVKMKSAGIDPTKGSMDALVGSVAKFGGTDEQLRRAAVAIQQMAGKGVISMEELRQQLGEAVPNAMELMARGMGLSMAELTDKVSKGTVEARSALAKMFIQMEIDSLGARRRMMETIPGMISQLKTQWELFKIEVAGGGAGTVFKEQLQGLIDFFKSADGKKFAQDTGEALKKLFLIAVDIKDALIAAWPAIKLFGAAWLLYFGGNQIKNLVDGVTAAVRGQLAVVNEATARKRAAIQEEINALQQKLDQERIAAQVADKKYEREIEGAGKAAKAKVDLAEKELAAAQKVATARRAEAAQVTQQAGQFYAKALDYERMVNQIDESGKARQGRKRQNFVDNMNAFREETTALQQKAVAIRQEADASVAAAERKVQAAQSQTTANGRLTASLMGTIMAQTDAANRARQGAQAIQEQIVAKERLINAAGSAAAMIGNFGKVLLAQVGWSLAITAALTGVAYLYDKITSSARKAKDEIAAVENLRKGQASRKDIEDSQGKLEKLQQKVRDANRYLAEVQNVDGGTGAFRKQIAEAKADVEKAEKEVKDFVSMVDGARKTLALSEAKAETSSRQERVSLFLEDTLRESAAYKTYQTEKQRQEEAKSSNDKKAMQESNVRFKTATTDYLNERAKIIRDLFNKQIQETQNPETRKQLGDELLRQLHDNDDKMREALRDPQYVVNEKGDKGAAALARREAQESPLAAMAANKAADLAQAQTELTKLNGDAKAFIDNAENKALFDLLGKLAAGEFDAVDPKTKKPVEPGKGVREGLVARFQEYVDAGKGSAADFINTLNFLDEKFRSNEKSAKDYFLAIVNGAGGLTEAEQRTKGMNSLMERQAAITEELQAATEQYNAGINFLPQGVVALERELAKLGARLRLTGQNFLEFEQAKSRALQDKFEAELLKDLTTSKQKAEDLQIQGIVNVRERELAEYNSRRQRVLDEYSFKRNYILKEFTDETRQAENLKRLEEQKNLELSALDAKHRLDSQTELDKLYRSWTNVYENIDTAVAGTMQRSMDALVNFVQTGKLEFGDLVRSILADFARIQLQQQFAPLMQAGGLWLTKFAQGMFTASANGNVMTPHGPLRLNKYQKGGIADRPQLSLFGEGSMNEAYVPLPDGRSIPVTMKAPPVQQAAGNVEVNVINQSGQPVSAEKGAPRFDGQKMILDVVLKAMNQPGSFREGMRGSMK